MSKTPLNAFRQEHRKMYEIPGSAARRWGGMGEGRREIASSGRLFLASEGRKLHDRERRSRDGGNVLVSLR